ncbi:tRNA (adenine(22)-N(1))-methyltransferase [Vallitalea guaymasensis]|uniref:SAM-dependent methyltransferase n=1 Tax=Vallitalea guaymasensis TaxID=1185412 RepID=A0A8J8M740_9FIRM|nr:class I SAM-dependent methyltransferase [Vallitalea guaymasensis]QUH27524.1 SAM-dependent methyltransferase [Vallitalea guaymasensis]
MEISNRLKAISDMVDNNSVIGDVGTDHGYIPIYLAKQHRIKHAIALDINKGPLEKAKKNIKEYNVENYVETRLSDGLKEMKENEVDTIIIAGMGGTLIERILDDGSNIVCSVHKLILSPHSDTQCIRKKIHELCFTITKEKLIKDEGKYYNIICAERGKEKKYDTIGYKYGKILIEEKEPLLKEKLQVEKNKYTQVLEILDRQNTENAIARKKEILSELNILEEVLGCL